MTSSTLAGRSMSWPRLAAWLALSAHCGILGGPPTKHTSCAQADGCTVSFGLAMAFPPPHAITTHSPRGMARVATISRWGARHGVGDVIGDADSQYDSIADHNVDAVIGDADDQYSPSTIDEIDESSGYAENLYDAVANDRVNDVIGGPEYRYEPIGTGNDGESNADGEQGYSPIDEQKGNIQTINTGRTSTSDEFDAVVNSRYACTRFRRHREPPVGTDNSTLSQPSASVSDPTVVQNAHHCLALSQRAPTGFNAQPYRVVLVHAKEDKQRLAQYCLGRNADRVRDADCTAVFLADRECGRDGKRFENFLVENMDCGASEGKRSTSRTRRQLSQKALFKLRMLILLFSSGYPLPRFLAVPLSFGVRLGMSILSFFARCLHSLRQKFRVFARLLPDIQLLPTLGSSETWSQKNTMLVAMTYMLACTSRGLATCPMEGFDAAGVRRALEIPRGRFGIPLIVSTGTPHRRNVGEDEETDDVGLSHGGGSMSPRFPLDEVVFGNAFGKAFSLGAA
ncbi:hypothetical protein ACHAXT_011757 [Thalassiosira profunda]